LESGKKIERNFIRVAISHGLTAQLNEPSAANSFGFCFEHVRGVKQTLKQRNVINLWLKEDQKIRLRRGKAKDPCHSQKCLLDDLIGSPLETPQLIILERLFDEISGFDAEIWKLLLGN
jgi:hypothetical protein